jgi:hypothetical protein
MTSSVQEVLGRTNDLHSFHYKSSIWHKKDKTITFEKLQCRYYWWEGFIKYAVKMTSGGMIQMPSFMTIGLSIQVILRLLLSSQQFQRLQCWYYWWEIFMKNATEMASGGMTYIPSFMTIGSGIQVISRLLLQQFERLQCSYYWWDGFMGQTTEMDSGGIIYIPSFIKIGTGVRRLLGDKTHRQQGHLISLL